MKLVFILLLLPYASSTFGQLTSKEWETIQKSNSYLIGMGVNPDIEEARQTALSDLASKISTEVSSRFDYVLINENKGKAVNSEARMKSVINSYSNVTLKNVAEHVIKGKKEYVVYRYMKVSDMRAMFKQRIGLAKKWAKEAILCETEGRIGDALQGFYWALALLNSCPDADDIFIDYEETPMGQDIQKRVKAILKDIAVKALSVEKEQDGQYVMLEFMYKGKPAVNFKYRYQIGKSLSEVYTAKNGEGEICIPCSATLKGLKLQAEYECRDEANINPDIQSVMKYVDPMTFEAAKISVQTKECRIIQSVETVIKPEFAKTDAYETVPESGVSQFLQTMQSIEKGISQRNFQSLRSCFTSEGWDMFDKLIHYGNAKLLRAPVVEFLPDRDGGAICRSFPMSFSFKNNKRTFIENVVFYLNGEAKVTEVAFGLEQAAVDDVMNRGPWTQNERQMLIHFLETYKTAYALKRLDYIDAIFSQEALIMTGSVVRRTGQKEMQPAKMSYIKYTRQTKEQYMKNLRKCFASNEYVNIHFGDNKVKRTNTPKFQNYIGIQIKQDYFSSTYGDTGYLFLLFDFANPATPIIHVRTWQPDKEEDIKDGRLDLGYFLY